MPAIPERNKAVTADISVRKYQATSFQTANLQAPQRQDDRTKGSLRGSDLQSAADNGAEYVDIDSYKSIDDPEERHWPNQADNSKRSIDAKGWQPTKLSNGKWSCNHKCKNKISCKHLCCHEGLDQPPKRPKASFSQADSAKELPKSSVAKATSVGTGKENAWPPTHSQCEQSAQRDIEEIDLTMEGSASFGDDGLHNDGRFWPQRTEEMDFTMFPKCLTSEDSLHGSVKTRQLSQQGANESAAMRFIPGVHESSDTDNNDKLANGLSDYAHVEEPSFSVFSDWPSQSHETPRNGDPAAKFFINSSSPPFKG